MRPREILFLFAIGAAGGLVGDAGNVQSGITQYMDSAGPLIWKSAWWFPLLVGLGTIATGVTRLRLGPTRPGFDPRIGVGAFAGVIAIYAASDIAFWNEGLSDSDSIGKVVLCSALALLVASFIADVPGILCGLGAAIAGPAVEIAIVNLDLSRYAPLTDGLFGVALWLPPLYFAFGVAVARITELIVARRTPAT
jgi:hypothetical protein